MGVLQDGEGSRAGAVSILSKLCRKDIMKNIMFDQSPGRNEEMSNENIWGRLSQQVLRP